jgi:UDP-glucuronate 4-epimerase
MCAIITPNSSAIQRDLGFEPSTAIDEGIPRFVDWYRAYHRC